MHLFFVIVKGMGLIFGSLLSALLLCWALWSLLRLVRHPEWVAPLILVPIVLGWSGGLPPSEFLSMTLVFALFAAIPLWFEGRNWRLRWEEEQGLRR